MKKDAELKSIEIPRFCLQSTVVLTSDSGRYSPKIKYCHEDAANCEGDMKNLKATNVSKRPSNQIKKGIQRSANE